MDKPRGECLAKKLTGVRIRATTRTRHGFTAFLSNSSHPIGAASALSAATPALPAPLVVVPATPSPAAPKTAVDAQAGALMSQARIALDAGNRTAAIESLNRLLNLPPNRFSQEAQELRPKRCPRRRGFYEHVRPSSCVSRRQRRTAAVA